MLRPSKGWADLRLRELWDYRELLFFLTWRDVTVRYRQTAVGALWAILQPLLAAAVFTLIFARVARIPSDGVPYAVFAYVAMLPWMFFSNAILRSGGSLVGNAGLIRKIYFPRLHAPISAVLANLADFAPGFLVLFVMMAIYRVPFSLRILWFPVPMLITVAASLGVGFWLSALDVRFRDVRFLLPFLTQLWFFASPIVYPGTMVITEPLRSLYPLNPMAGAIEGFRWALLGTHVPPPLFFVTSALSALTLLVSGALFFRRMERTFADVI